MPEIYHTTSTKTMHAITQASSPLSGDVIIAGDKSMSHRALMLASIAEGETLIHGLLEGDDVMATCHALQACGANIKRHDDDSTIWQVKGRPLHSFHEPDHVLHMGNSGTSTRLLMGLLAGTSEAIFFDGDASLNKRPMARVSTPLAQMNVNIITRYNGLLPLYLKGNDPLIPIEYRLPIASAQVKSALLLAGLSAKGCTMIIEAEPTRDHTENMLRHFGVHLDITRHDNDTHISLEGGQVLTARNITVPGDISSAAFIIAAALMVPHSHVTIKPVGINPTRNGILQALALMGADIGIDKVDNDEPYATLNVKHQPLHGAIIPKELAPLMIDEYPILAMIAAQSEGTTRFEGISELKVKESNRLQAVIDGLTQCNITTRTGINNDGDWLEIDGQPNNIQGGGTITTHLDHRIAMSFLILGLVSKNPITVDDVTPVTTSFPNFFAIMHDIGASIKVP